MRCKKHPADLSSSVGVCASCLRERLFSVIAAQEQALAQKQAQARSREDRLEFDAEQPPPAFPQSASPYISHRNSATAAASRWHLNGHDQRFYSTPQVGPTGYISAVDSSVKMKCAGGRISSLFSGLFRSKTGKPDLDSGQNPDSSVSCQLNSRDSCNASPLWFSDIIPGRRKKQIQTFSLDENTICAQRRTCRNLDRGMSPVRYSDEEDEHCNGGSSGYSSESSQGWKQTPRKTPVIRRGGGRQGHSKNVTHLAFCLSPLVRASPNRHWNHMGLPPEMVVAGASKEIRVPTKPYLSTAASLGKNRSRKLADFGRYNPNN
ncbi:uncharacterized protein LOC111386949 [Olea europaea var. sylvestris]|uniref:uncharacterized protein LOC111386949 n=1 Tax=Olea europaea var. sylvestris TaxID=158386 RepID=UPI000C1D0377|nr:uncharacterized protein LOC111386949 [Olea europaea var. sylvestris]